MRHSITHLVGEVHQLRHPSFTQAHIELLLPNIISLLQSLNSRVRSLEVAVARREHILEKHMKEPDTFRELLILRLPRVPSTNVVGVQASDKGHHSDEPVVRTTPAAEITDVDPDNSGVQLSAETALFPMNREQAVPEPIQDIRLSTDVEQAIAEAIHDTNVSTGPSIPPPDTASP